METGSVAAVVSTALAALGALFATFRYVVAEIEAARKEAAAAIVNAALLQDKARHDLGNHTTIAMNKIETALERLQREAVRREEMTALEARMKEGQTRIETKVDRLDEKIDVLLTRPSAK